MKRQRSRTIALAVAFALAGISSWAGWRTLFSARRPVEAPAATPSDASPARAYAGSTTCQACHQAEFEKWAGSHHALAETTNLTGLDVTSLAPERPQRVIGVAPLRQFVVKKGDRQQVLPTAYDPTRNDWFSVHGGEDRKPGEWDHWTGRGMSWNSMCAYCHNTALEKNYDVAADSFRTTMAEMGVGCEACHGPSKAHVEWRQQHPLGGTDPTVVARDRRQNIDTCGSCHARRTELTGEFRPGDAFADHFGLEVPDLGESFFADGQVHDENYELTSFLGSKMFRAGVACQDCHDPHDGKTFLTGNALCMRCHGGGNPKSPRIDPAAHTFHATESAGSACVGCHMPTTTYVQRHARRDHGFTIPDPRLTALHKIPNACTRCHADKPPAWAEKMTERWYGPKMDRPTRARAEIVARARNGDATIAPALREMLSSDDMALWRATAAQLSERFLADADLLRAVVTAIDDRDALVRTSAARVLESALGTAPDAVLPALQKALDDPVRSVRIAAAWSLRARISDNHRSTSELVRYLDLSADQPKGQAQKGAFELARGHKDSALAHFEKAVSWDPGSAPLRHELAIAYGSAGRPLDAVAQLEAAVRIAPGDAEYRFALGLALSETGKLSEAIEAFERAEVAEPRNASFPYARATVLLRLGKKDAARRAAERSLAIDPHHPQARALLGSL